MSATTAAGTPASQTDARAIYAGVFLVSMAMLLLQIALTRIFSFTLWYHFAYVTISVALLGYGASGSMLAVMPGLAGATPARRLPLYAFACALATVVGLAVFAAVPFHPFEMMTLLLTGQFARIRPVQVAYVLAFYAAVTTPFFFAGLCVSIALRALSRDVSRLYFFDLLGAGIGCLLVVFVVGLVEVPGTVVVAAVLVALAGVLFTRAERRTSLLVPLAGVALVALTGVTVVRRAEFLPSPEKFLYPFAVDQVGTRHFGHYWSAIFRTDAFGYVDEELTRSGSYAQWGSSQRWKTESLNRGPRLRFITHDGDAGAVVYSFDGDLAKLELFDNLVLKAPYVLLDHPDVLVIGVGGGTDIVNAVKQRAHHVTGVELDPETVRLVREDHADFVGHLYDRPDVTILAGEGRSTLRHSGARYDLIQLTGVDTLAALSTGAYVLSESYLYTTEAMREFLDHLTPDGVLSIVVGELTAPIGAFPRHSMRQLALFVDALERMGVGDPAAHIALIASTEPLAQVAMLLKPTTFSAEDVRRLQRFADDLGFRIWALPGVQAQSIHAQYLALPRDERTAFLARQSLILTPTTDDNPFFFNFYRWRRLPQSRGELDVGHTFATGQIVLAFLLVVAIVLSAVLILLPLLLFRRQGLRTPGTPGLTVFFAAIGLGFMFIEISFVQRFVLFLGYPTYALTVVLFSLLTFSGIGSALTGRLRRPPEERFVPLLVVLATVTAVSLVALPQLFAAFLGSAFALRVVIATLSLLPLGLVLGMFFPSGIHVVRRLDARLVPWAWAVNGCASVVGTILAVIVAMGYGFRTVSLCALAVYLLGVLAMRATTRALRDAEQAPPAALAG